MEATPQDGSASEQAIKEFQGVLRKARQLKERWNQRLTLENLSLTKCYLEEKLVLTVVMRILGEIYKSAEFGAVFKRKQGSTNVQPQRNVRDLGLHTIRRKFDGPCCIGGSNECGKVVFFGDATSVELPQSVVASTVRLEFLDHAYNICPGSLYFSQSVGFKFLKAIGNRESAVSVGGAAFRDDEMAD